MVIDSSIAGSWCFLDEWTQESDNILRLLDSGEAEAPSIWPTEVTNAVLAGAKRGRITPKQEAEFFRLITSLDVDVQPPSTSFPELLFSARNHGLTVYDATYVDLALRHQLPLASLDTQMREAASKAGVALLP